MKNLDTMLDGDKSPTLDKNITILGLLNKFKLYPQPGKLGALSRAQVNEKLYHGVQSDILNSLETQNNEINNQLNYFHNLVNSLAARLQEDRPYVKGFPTSMDSIDVAKIVDLYLSHMFRIISIDNISMDMTIFCILHAQVYCRVTWDPEGGSPLYEKYIDEDGNKRRELLGKSGETAWEIFTIYDVDYDGSDPQNSEWCTITKMISETEALGLFKDEGLEDDELHKLQFESDDSSSGPFCNPEDEVELVEMWVKPGHLMKKGLYATVVGGNVLKFQGFPYDHGQIPVIKWAWQPRFKSRWSTSPSDFARESQIYIDHLQGMKSNLVLNVADFTKLLAVGALAEEMGDQNVVIQTSNVIDVTQGTRWIDPPSPPPILFDEQDKAISSMHSVFGLNEMLAGHETAKSGTSAKSIAYLQKNDSMKNAPAMRRFEKFMELAIKQSIKLFAQFAVTPRYVQLFDEDDEEVIAEIRGEELLDSDIIVEPASGIERFAAQQEAEIEKELQMGIAKKGSIGERLETGLGESSMDADIDKQAKALVQNAAQGQPVQMDPGIPPGLIHKYILKYKDRYDPNNPGIARLKQMIFSKPKPAPQGQPAPQGPPPQGPGGPQ